MSDDEDLQERLRRGRRRNAILSVVASPLMVILGVVFLFVLPRPGAGIFCIVFGSVACLLWLFLWPLYRRKGRI